MTLKFNRLATVATFVFASAAAAQTQPATTTQTTTTRTQPTTPETEPTTTVQTTTTQTQPATTTGTQPATTPPASATPVQTPADTQPTASEPAATDATATAQTGQLTPAPTADIKAKASVYDQSGALVGKIDSVDADGAIVNTGKARAEIPLSSFGKNDKGLVVTATKADLEAPVKKETKETKPKS